METAEFSQILIHEQVHSVVCEVVLRNSAEIVVIFGSFPLQRGGEHVVGSRRCLLGASCRVAGACAAEGRCGVDKRYL